MQGTTEVLLGLPANLIPFYCFLTFSVLVTRYRSRKATWAAIIPLFMLLLQPVVHQVYAGPAFLAVLLAWEMLDMGFIKPVDAVPTTVLDVYLAAFMHSIHGMLIVRQRRSSGTATPGIRPAESTSTAVDGAACCRKSSNVCATARTAQQEQQPGDTTAADVMLAAQPFCAKSLIDKPSLAAVAVAATDSDAAAQSTGALNRIKSDSNTCKSVVEQLTAATATQFPSNEHLFTAAHCTAFISVSLAVLRRLLIFNIAYAAVMAMSRCSNQLSSDSSALRPGLTAQPWNAWNDPVLQALHQTMASVPWNTAVNATLSSATGINVLQRVHASIVATTGKQPLLQYVALCAYSTAAGVVLTTQAALFWSGVKWALVAAGQLQLAAALPDDAFGGLLMATSIGDLWGTRWHQFYRYYFTSIGSKLAALVTGPWLLHLPTKYHKQATSAAGVLSGFFLSGVLHEYVLYAAYGTLSGSNMAFFMLHGAAVVVENVVKLLIPGVVVLPSWVGRLWTVGVAIASAPLMVRPFIGNGYFCHPVQPGLWGDMGVGTAGVILCRALYSATVG